MNIEVFYSKKTDDWKTPSRIYLVFMEKMYLDPCPYQAKQNGLLYDFVNAKIYLNPPFSIMAEFVDWAIRQYREGNKIVFLIPARTDTKYFHKLLELNPSLYFIKGRLKYNDTTGAPFPSVMIILDNKGKIYHGDEEELIKFIKENL